MGHQRYTRHRNCRPSTSSTAHHAISLALDSSAIAGYSQLDSLNTLFSIVDEAKSFRTDAGREVHGNWVLMLAYLVSFSFIRVEKFHCRRQDRRQHKRFVLHIRSRDKVSVQFAFPDVLHELKQSKWCHDRHAPGNVGNAEATWHAASDTLVRCIILVRLFRVWTCFSCILSAARGSRVGCVHLSSKKKQCVRTRRREHTGFYCNLLSTSNTTVVVRYTTLHSHPLRPQPTIASQLLMPKWRVPPSRDGNFGPSPPKPTAHPNPLG